MIRVNEGKKRRECVRWPFGKTLVARNGSKVALATVQTHSAFVRHLYIPVHITEHQATGQRRRGERRREGGARKKRGAKGREEKERELGGKEPVESGVEVAGGWGCG